MARTKQTARERPKREPGDRFKLATLQDGARKGERKRKRKPVAERVYLVKMTAAQVALTLQHALVHFKVTDDEWLAHRYAREYGRLRLSGKKIQDREEECVAMVQGPWHPDIGEGALRILLHIQAVGVSAASMRAAVAAA